MIRLSFARSHGLRALHRFPLGRLPFLYTHALPLTPELTFGCFKADACIRPRPTQKGELGP